MKTNSLLETLVLGCLPFGGVVGPTESQQILRTAWQKGIRNFDVATLYGNGLAAGILQKTFSGQVGGPKFWVSIGLEKVPDSNGTFSVKVLKLSKLNIFSMVNSMLEKLSIEKIEVLNIHGPDETTSIGEILEALLELREAGKISEISISNFIPSELEDILKYESSNGVGFDIFQFHGNLLEQRLINEFEPTLKMLSKKIYCYRPIARGLLGRGYSRVNPRPIDSRSTRGWRLNSYLNDDLLCILEGITSLARKHEISEVELALYWLLQERKIDGAIIGARTIQQMNGIIDSSSFMPTKDFLNDLGELIKSNEFNSISNSLPLEYFEK
jgi:aryl-alcohol dehydrogenase-like predicted oxidoreductase